MGKYICGPSVLRFPRRAAIVPGDVFEYDYDPAHEALALASGAITLQPGETSMSEKIAAQEAASAAARRLAAAAQPSGPTGVAASPAPAAVNRSSAPISAPLDKVEKE